MTTTTKTRPLTTDELFPRDEANRYRIYTVPKGGGPSDMKIIATCGDGEAFGRAIVELAQEDEFEGIAVGVLDVLPDGKESETGRWLINPFAKVRADPLPTKREQLSRVGAKRLTEIVELGEKARELLVEHRRRREELNR